MRKVAQVLVLCAAAGQAVAADSDTERAVSDALIDGPSVLTSAGSLIVEPGLSYSHSTGTQVAIEGYTILPSLLVGLINVSEVQRDTVTASATLRYGLSRRWELEAKIPYVYREESVRERDVLEGTPTDMIRYSRGNDLGDVEFAVRYQLNRGLNGGPFFVAGVRGKTRTGRHPFEVEREPLFMHGENGEQMFIGAALREQPTGSGFYSLQPSLSFMLPTEPAVIFGSVSYLHNFSRTYGEFGHIDPGNALGLSYGMGFGVNERTSFSLAYDHHVVDRTRRSHDSGLNGEFRNFQVGSLLFSLSHRLSARTSLSLAVAIGATENAPDMQLSVRLPLVVLK